MAFNRIIHRSFRLFACLYIFMHYSLFNHYVKLYHCHCHFQLKGFFCFFCSNVVPVVYSWIYQFFSFFPVIVCLVIIIRVLHTSCDKFHKHEQHSRSTCTTTHNYISIAGKRQKCRDPRRHCWWHAMENNKQYYYTTIHRRDGTHFTT